MDAKAQRILNIYEAGVSETELDTAFKTRVDTIEAKADASTGGSLGSIKPTDAAPTPARNGNYTFSIGGNKPAWLTAEAGVTEVKAGDGVAVVYTEPSGYSYTHVDTGSSIEQVRSQSTGNVPSSKLLDDELNNACSVIGRNNALQGTDLVNYLSHYGEINFNIENIFLNGTKTLVQNTTGYPLQSAYLTHIYNVVWSTKAEKKIAIPSSDQLTVFTLGFWINKTKFDLISDRKFVVFNGSAWVGFETASINRLRFGYSESLDLGSGKSITMSCLATNKDWSYIQINSNNYITSASTFALKFSDSSAGDVDFAALTFLKSYVELDPYKIYYKYKSSITLSESKQTKADFKAEIYTENLQTEANLEYPNFWLNSGEVGFPENIVPATIINTPSDAPFSTITLPTIRRFSWTNDASSEKKFAAVGVMSDAPKITFMFWTKASQLTAINCTTISILSKVSGVQTWRTIQLPSILNEEIKNLQDEEMRLKLTSKYGDWVCYRLQWFNTIFTNTFMFKFNTSAKDGELYLANVFLNKSIVNVDPNTVRYKLRNSSIAVLIAQLYPSLNASKNFLLGNEFFSICDSLGVAGIWQTKLANLSGGIYDNAKNTNVAAPLSIGGTGTIGFDKSCGQWRARNFVSNYPTAKFLFIENINDMNFAGGSITDTPFMLSRVDYLADLGLTDLTDANNYWTNNFASIIEGYSALKGAVINVPYYGVGKNLAITSLPTSNGNVTLNVNGKVYSIPVTTSDTIQTIRTKILEYQYEYIIDAPNADGLTVDFYYSAGVTLTFGASGTGMSVSITNTSTAQVFTPRWFIGEASEWTNPEKWTSTPPSIYAAYRGLIEYLQKNMPTCELIWIIPTRYGLSLSNYLRVDGTYDIDAYNASDTTYQSLCVRQKAVCDFYNIRYVDLNKKAGITLYNMLSYYNENNVHPKTVGYEKWGEMIYKMLIG